jgi:NAD+ kinase
MSSRPGSTTQSAEAVRRAAVVTHGKPETIGPALARLEEAASAAGVELLLPSEEVAKHGLSVDSHDRTDVDIAVVLGGDGTMLRALKRFRDTGVPVIGVNFGSVGFLTSIPANQLESGLRRVFEGDYRVVQLRSLAVEAHGARHTAVNDVVLRSAILGRMVHLSWMLGGEDLGSVACDGIICASPVGSTAYNLSNGGPVVVWGLEAMAISFLAPHSLHVRPIVVPRGLDLEITNITPDVPAAIIVDGHAEGELGLGQTAVVRVAEQATLIATLPEATFFCRYRETFVH